MPPKYAIPMKRKTLTIMRYDQVNNHFEKIIRQNSTITAINYTRKALIDAKLLLAYESDSVKETFYIAIGALDV